ncbi:hypothetical protein BKA56DRAFT_698586 [Ilyonectria sp. MPI-CAGE-AT-0026]|nr:hypothetical protein BKA56DRAFT_698586 [Ilyonectria sp. MPI-CAGE-AT-0026]
MPPSNQTNTTLPSWTPLPERKKRGSKPKPLKDRKARPSKSIVRPQRSYTKKKKDEVLMWLIHHRIKRRGETSPPSIRDAELHFKIPCSTIQGWKQAYAKSEANAESELCAPVTPSVSNNANIPIAD